MGPSQQVAKTEARFFFHVIKWKSWLVSGPDWDGSAVWRENDPRDLATFFLEECWTFWWPGMEKENLCTLKSFMASGTEACTQARR